MIWFWKDQFSRPLPDDYAEADSALVVSSALCGRPAMAGYASPAMAAPTMGATQKSHNCSNAHPPTNTAGPVLRAGLTERLVTGMPIRWISVSPKPMAMGAKPFGAR